MVTEQEKAELIKEFERSFHVTQQMRVWVDDETLEVNVKAYAVRMKVKKRIPVKLGLVIGKFDCYECELDSLENAPHTVTGSFSCYNNMLTSLEGGPQHVGSTEIGGGTYSCTGNFLKNFEHAPQDFSGYFVAVKQMGMGLESVDGLPENARLVDLSYQPNLPMLKLIRQKQVNIRHKLTGELITDLTDIINDFSGQGKAGSIACAVRMIKAGYKGNARW